MECQNRSDKYIWSPHDAYFYKGLSELIVDIDRLIYLSLEKIRKDFVFINLSTDSLSEFINRDNEWLSAVKGKQVVLIAARKSEALANYWYYNSNIRGVVYAGLSRDIREGANKQVISSQADSLIKISRIWADFFPANTSNQPI